MLSKMAHQAGVEAVSAFGEKRGAKFTIKEILPTRNGSHIKARLGGEDIELDLGLPGFHMAATALACCAAARLT